jgi:hypothetical protein
MRLQPNIYQLQMFLDESDLHSDLKIIFIVYYFLGQSGNLYIYIYFCFLCL